MPVVDPDTFQDLLAREKDLLARQQINFAIDSDAKIRKTFEDAIRRYEVALHYINDSEDALPKNLVGKAGAYFQRMRLLKDLQQQLVSSPIPLSVEMTHAEIAGAIAVTAQQKAISVSKKYEISKKVALGSAQVTKQVGDMASWFKKKGSKDAKSNGSGTRVILCEDESPIAVFDQASFPSLLMPSDMTSTSGHGSPPNHSLSKESIPWAQQSEMDVDTINMFTDYKEGRAENTVTQDAPAITTSGVFEIESDDDLPQR